MVICVLQQLRALKLVITSPVWRNGQQFFPAVALQVVRFVLLLLAMVVAFSRPQQLRARLAALMFAIGAVAEGYPSSGWAAGLRHLPAVLAILIGVGYSYRSRGSALFFFEFHPS